MKNTYGFYENSLKFIINNIGAILFILLLILGISIFTIVKNVSVKEDNKYSLEKMRYEKDTTNFYPNMLSNYGLSNYELKMDLVKP